MNRSVSVLCYYGPPNGQSIQCHASIALSGGAMSETMALSFMDKHRITLPFRPVERLATSVLARAPRSSSYPAIEEDMVVDGFYSGGGVMLRPGKVGVWFRSNGQVDMVTVSYEDTGQISVPYTPIAGLAKSQRSNWI